MNWQLDQCYREGCKLERKLAEVQNLLKQCLSSMPVGYIPTHTAENLPEMIGDLAKALAEETTERENLERELGAINAERAESRGLRKAWVELDDKRQDLEKQLSIIIEQRDRLVEELDALKQSILDLSHPNMKLLLEERDEAREDLKITQEAWVKAGIERIESFRERDEAREQRDKLAEELKEAQDAIGLMLKDSSCRTIPRYAKEQLNIVTGEGHE
jgi:chromosome segregation ATPase